jgi:hypothetical protein
MSRQKTCKTKEKLKDESLRLPKTRKATGRLEITVSLYSRAIFVFVVVGLLFKSQISKDAVGFRVSTAKRLEATY